MQNAKTPLIEFKNVSKKYGGSNVLDDVSLKIYSGEFVFVVGSSGAGKSTFLKLINAEEHPDEGEVLFFGRSLDRIVPRYLPYFRRKIGYVYQDFRLLDKRSVYENIALPLHVLGVPSHKIRPRVKELLALMKLTKKSRIHAEELSGGEQQRVALARALAGDPILILADEPTGNVDPKLATEIVGLLDKINCDYGTTIVIVTHEHMMARRFHRRVIALERGNVVEDGVPFISQKLIQRELEQMQRDSEAPEAWPF